MESGTNIGNLIDIVQRETLRTRLLLALDEIYPKWLRTDILYAVDKEVSAIVIDRELAYLSEKHLVERKSPREGKVFANKITARGRDFLDGHIQEVGLAAPQAFRGTDSQ